MANDSIDTRVLVSIREARLLAVHLTEEETATTSKNLLGLDPLQPPTPKRKYLYIFSSDGLDYGISRDAPGWESRTNSVLSGQHCAPPLPGASNPARSKSLAVERVEREVYFDSRGLAYEIGIAKTWELPRHKRPHPLFGNAPVSQWERLEEKLNEPGGGQARGRGGVFLPPLVKDKPRRYFLLLSPIRLGPKSLQFAKDNPDALTLWFDPREAFVKGKISGPSVEFLLKLQADPDPKQQIRLFTLLTQSVVDPYAFAERMREKLLGPVQERFFDYMNDIDRGYVPGIDRRHFKPYEYLGSLGELTALAHAVSRIQQADDDLIDLIDQEALDQVMGIYGFRLEAHIQGLEYVARFCANWLSGPQHQAIDLTAVKDCEDKGDAKAGVDKASALGHWFCQFRALQGTGHGAEVISRLLSKKFDGVNPMRDLFLIYGAKGKVPIAGSTDEHAIRAIQDIVPDAALFSYFQFGEDELGANGQPDPNKAPQKRAEVLAHLINNVGYFNSRLGTDPAEDPDRLVLDGLGKKFKYAYKSTLYAREFWDKVDTLVAKPFKTNLAADLSDDFFTRIRQRMLGLKPIGTELKELNDLAQEAETEADLARRMQQISSKDIKGIEKQINAINDDIVAKSDPNRLTGFYSDALTKRELMKREMARLNEESVKLERQIASAKRAAVGDPKVAVVLGKRESLVMLREQNHQEFLRKRRDLRYAEMEIRIIEKAAAERKISLQAAQRDSLEKLSKLKSQRDGNFKFWKEAESKATQSSVDVRQKINDLTEEQQSRLEAQDRRAKGLGPAKLFASVAFLILEISFAKDTFDTTERFDKRAWAVADLGKAAVDLAKDYTALRNIKVEALPEEWRQRLFLAKSGPVGAKATTALWKSNCVGVLGIIGGLHTVVKYGVATAKGLSRDDTDFALATGIAAFGGLITAAIPVLTLLGYESVYFGPVGAIAGLLTAVGIIAAAFLVDSEWETFLKHCYFAKKESRRNHRIENDENHWLGPADSGAAEGFWGVREQLAAFDRLRARPEIYSRAMTLNFPNDESTDVSRQSDHGNIRWTAQLTIDFPGVASGSSMKVDFRAVRKSGEREQIYAYFIGRDRLNQGPRRDDSHGARMGFFAPADRNGFVVFIFGEKQTPFFHSLVADIEYQLPDGTYLSATHTILTYTVINKSPSLDTPLYYAYYETNEYSTFADKFSSVPAIHWSP